MSTFKKAKIIMLSTNEPSKIGNLATYQKRSLAKVIKEGINPIGSTVQFWNLYTISDDEIKENDWYYDNVVLQIRQWKSFMIYNKLQHKKVIATTDESLYYKDTSKNPKQYMGSYISMSLGENLPQPSQQFIQKYIEEYNKGNVITDVLVEYELVSNEEYFLNTINPDDDVLYFDENLKINHKDNTITIKKVKDSYTREEVIEFGNKVKEYCKDVWKTDSLHRVFFEWDKWVKENLS